MPKGIYEHKSHSEETKEKIRKGNLGKNNPMYGVRRFGKDNPMYGIHRFGKNAPTWNGGISFEPYTFEFNNQLKKLIRERDIHQCQFCGINENGRNHDAHHIDYNKKNCNPRNLIILCQSHNKKANFNREKWQFLFETLQELRKI